VFGRILGQASLAHEVPDESANGGQPAGHAGGLETRPPHVLDVLDDVVGAYPRERTPRVVEEREELVEIAPVGGHRVS
jgi:hypothetical protein